MESSEGSPTLRATSSKKSFRSLPASCLLLTGFRFYKYCHVPYFSYKTNSLISSTTEAAGIEQRHHICSSALRLTTRTRISIMKKRPIAPDHCEKCRDSWHSGLIHRAAPSPSVSVLKLATCSGGGTDLRWRDVTTIKIIFPQALRNWARHRRAFHGGGV
jgi:hypothetical protein